MAESRDKVRILAVVSSDLQSQIRRQLDSLDMSTVFVCRAEELGHCFRNGEVYEVALLPEILPDGIDWWTIWGELALLTHRPAILVYAASANFQLWSGVLEAGGYDVVVEPYPREKLIDAVLRAAQSFALRYEIDAEAECAGEE